MDWKGCWNSFSNWILTSGLRILIILAVAMIAWRLVGFVSRALLGRLVKKDGEIKNRAESLGAAIRYALNITIVILAGVLILEQLNINIVRNGLRIILILVGTLAGLWVAKFIGGPLIARFVKQDGEIKKRADTLGSVIQYALSFTVIVIAAIMILGEFGIEIGPIIAAAGVVGLAIGFGAQGLVQDVISGFFILLEDQIRVGDIVDIGKAGLVEKINLRMTVLRDAGGNVHYIRNGQINVITNMTKEYSRYVFDIGVAYRENVDEVMAIIKEVDVELRQQPDFAAEILEPIEVLGLDKFGDSAIIIKARYKTKPGKQWLAAREFNRRLKMAFDARNIEIPFPHMTVYMGEPKQRQAAPMNINMINPQ